MKERILSPILAPILVIAIGSFVAYVFHLFMNEWAWSVLAFVYWGSSFFIAYKALGKEAIRSLFQKPIGSKG